MGQTTSWQKPLCEERTGVQRILGARSLVGADNTVTLKASSSSLSTSSCCSELPSTGVSLQGLLVDGMGRGSAAEAHRDGVNCAMVLEEPPFQFCFSQCRGAPLLLLTIGGCYRPCSSSSSCPKGLAWASSHRHTHNGTTNKN